MILVVTASELGLRLDQLVATRLGVSVNEARRLIDQKRVKLEHAPTKKGSRLTVGMRVQVLVEPRKEGDRIVGVSYAPTPEAGELLVLYEDEALVVVDKPAGIATHPLVPHETGTAANLLAARFPECREASTEPRDGGFVHRLDRDTTGVLMAARTRPAYERLRATFSQHDVEKTYWALVHGELESMVIDAPLVTRGDTAKVVPYDDKALPARTAVKRILQGNGFSFVEAHTTTGRLHQVRAHLAHAGHPIVGDKRYGGAMLDGIDGVQLHARAVSLPHPIDAWVVTYAAPLPASRLQNMERILEKKLPA